MNISPDMTLLIEIGIIIIVATFFGFLMRIFKQPLIPAYIITGILIGPLVFGLIKDESLIFSLSQIGVAFLIFTAGLEIKFNKVKEVGKVSFIGGLLQIVILFLIAFFVTEYLGFVGKAPIYIGLIVAFSSTMIVVKILSERDEIDTLHGRIAIGILVLQDIAAIIALSILTNNLSVSSFLILLGKAIVFIFAAFVLTKISNPIFRIAARNTEFLLLVAVSFLFLFIIGASFAGLSLIIGAFFAGVVLANSDYKTEIEGKISGLKEFFSLIFFVALGMQLRLISGSYIVLLGVLIGLVMIIKPIITMIIVRLFGYEKRTSFLTGNAIAQASEFSFIIVALGYSLNQISQELFSTLILLTVLSMYLSTYFINYERGFYKLFGSILSPFNRIRTKEEKNELINFNPDVVIFGCHRMGSLFLKEFQNEKKKVLVVDYNPEIIKSLKEKNIPCIYGDFMNNEIFNKINIKNVNMVISTIADVEDNLALMKKVRKANPQALVFIVAKRISEAKSLYNAGADYVILPMVIGGQKSYELIRKISKDKSGLKELKREHIKYLDSVHHILY